MATAAKSAFSQQEWYARLLRTQRAAILTHLREHRQAMIGERLPEDEGALANRTLFEDLAIDTLEREEQLLREIDAALRRLEQGRFGACELCGEEIPERRLRALPWTRLCLRCAELQTAFSPN